MSSFASPKSAPSSTDAGLLQGFPPLLRGCGCYLRFLLPPDHTLFQAVNVVFLLCILPCPGLVSVSGAGDLAEKKLFVFSLRPHRRAGHQLHPTMPSAPCCVSPVLYDGLPYHGRELVILAVLTGLLLPLFWLCWRDTNARWRRADAQGNVPYLAGLALFSFCFWQRGCPSSSTIFSTTYVPVSISTLFVLVLYLIYLIFFKMMYLSMKAPVPARRGPGPPSLLSVRGGAVPPHLRQHREAAAG